MQDVKSKGATPLRGGSNNIGVNMGSNSYQRVLRRLRPAFYIAFGFSAIVSVLMLTGSIYMLQVYDRVLSSGSIPTLLVLFGIVVVLHVFLAFYDFLRSRLMARAAVQLNIDLGPDVFQAWVAAGVPGYHGDALSGGPQSAERATPAEIKARGTFRPLSDLEVVRGFLSGPAAIGLMDVPWVPIYLAVLFLIHPWLGWLTIGGAVVVAVLAALNRVLTRNSIGAAMSGEAAARDFAESGRQGGETVLAMGMMGAVTDRWHGLQLNALKAGQIGSDPSEILAAASKSFRMLLQSAILTLGAYLVIRQEISGGMIIASSILSGRALGPLDQVIGQWRSIGRAVESHKKLIAFFDKRGQEKQRIDLPKPTGNLTVSAATKYAPGQARTDKSRILTGVNFALEPGDGLGVIGNSAAGKSTLARILTGAWTLDAGEIRFDGATPDQWDPETLGRSIGYLPQSLDLIPGTIRDIIARFDPQAQDGAVIEAAQTVGVHDMILGLPDGYATRVGGGANAGGMPLSGGQIQRIGLARAVYGWPKIVVLDEPNANLDVAGDAALSAAITALRKKGSTVIVMAHRPSAIAAVNKLLVLHSGRVMQFGDKAEVLGDQIAASQKTAKPASAAMGNGVAGDAVAGQDVMGAQAKPAPILTPVLTPVLTSGLSIVHAKPTQDGAGPQHDAVYGGRRSTPLGTTEDLSADLCEDLSMGPNITGQIDAHSGIRSRASRTFSVPASKPRPLRLFAASDVVHQENQ